MLSDPNTTSLGNDKYNHLSGGGHVTGDEK